MEEARNESPLDPSRTHRTARPTSDQSRSGQQKGTAMSKPGTHKAEALLAGLGGADNIEDMEACITRLRTEVRDAALVDEAALKAAGAMGVVKQGRVVQVVVGPEADTIAEDMQDLM
ncbi:glucose PTS transporter subunit EIIB [Raineyella fluvialis]|uniref:PTS EIIB type-1 domain-containing protein n=1 Tax=Raineyella fluvialis TaxID=2662261 RepID=A0A5Q2FAN4_9ACTN|nr:glucose PTS transporter subunit EIIB [Raineyella fluvialis]QGF23441.1 hypothetical protein Rai3103_06915 [Raineyella fluvialis]